MTNNSAPPGTPATMSQTAQDLPGGVQIDLEVPLERAEVAKPGPKTVVPCRGLVPTPFPGLRQYPLNTEHGALRLGDDIDKLLHMAQIPS